MQYSILGKKEHYAFCQCEHKWVCKSSVSFNFSSDNVEKHEDNYLPLNNFRIKETKNKGMNSVFHTIHRFEFLFLMKFTHN